MTVRGYMLHTATHVLGSMASAADRTNADPDAQESELPRRATSLTLRALVDLHGDFVWRLLRRYGLEDAAADDATQQVFLVAAKKLGAIQEGRERAFLYTIAVRIAARAHRSARRSHEVELDASGEEPADEPWPDELLDRQRARVLLDGILGEMGEPFRAVFVLVEIEEMTMTETAECLEIPVGTVSSRLRKARLLFEQISERVRLRRLGRHKP